MSEAPVISPDHHVTIRYSIFEEGAEEASPGAEDLTETYVHGYGQVFPAIERGLEGKTQGTHVSVLAEADEAFGPREDEGVFELDKDGLDGASELSPGEEVVASGPEGDILMRILEVRPETLLVDTNHPLAGKRVRFEVDVVAVRPATEEEIEEAQEDLDEDGDACGCGHDHSPSDPHEEPNDLVQLSPKKKN